MFVLLGVQRFGVIILNVRRRVIFCSDVCLNLQTENQQQHFYYTKRINIFLLPINTNAINMSSCFFPTCRLIVIIHIPYKHTNRRLSHAKGIVTAKNILK